MRFTTLVLAVAILALAACQQSVGPAGVDQPSEFSLEDIPGPRFNFSNGPITAGIVERSDSDFFSFLFFNPEALLLSLHSPEDSHNIFFPGGGLFCDEATEIIPWDTQLAFSGAEAIREMTQAKNAFISVWDVTGFLALNCDLLTNVTGRLVAEGSAKFFLVDNDIFLSGPGGNAFQWEAHGHLTDVATGEPVDYQMFRKWLITPDGTFSELVRKGPILNPDPR